MCPRLSGGCEVGAAEYLYAEASACPHPSDAQQMGPKSGTMFIGDYGKWMPTADPGA